MPEGLEVDFVRASSYQGTESSSTVALHVPDSLAVSGRHVLLVRSPLARASAPFGKKLRRICSGSLLVSDIPILAC